MISCETLETMPGCQRVTIQLPEHFDYRSIHTFRQLYQRALSAEEEVVVDMAFTRYLDSSGIALLLCLHQWLKHPAGTVKINHCRADLRQILKLGRCENKFLFG